MKDLSGNFKLILNKIYSSFKKKLYCPENQKNTKKVFGIFKKNVFWFANTETQPKSIRF